MAAGVEDLRRWLRDAVRGGLGAGRLRSWDEWDAFAARLVDAQAPGAASRLRSLGGVAAGRPDGWPERLLCGLGLLHLLCEAHTRADGRGARRRARAAGLERRARGGAGRAARERPLDGPGAGGDRAGAPARAAHVAVGRRDRPARARCWTSRRRARRWSRGRRPGWRSRARWPFIRGRRRCGRSSRRIGPSEPGGGRFGAGGARGRRCARWRTRWRQTRGSTSGRSRSRPRSWTGATTGRGRVGTDDGSLPLGGSPERPLAGARLLRRAADLRVRALERRRPGPAGRGRRRADGRAVRETLFQVRRARAEDAGGIARAWVRAWQVAYREPRPGRGPGRA